MNMVTFLKDRNLIQLEFQILFNRVKCLSKNLTLTETSYLVLLCKNHKNLCF